MIKKIKYVLNRIYPEKVARPMTKYIMKQNKDNLVGVEIGTHRGENAYNMLRLLNIKKLYLVDPYLPKEQKRQHYKKANRILKKWKRKIQFHVTKSEDASSFYRYKTLDFVYIDGDHSYEAVKKDIELYYPKVIKGGVIGGHDFCGSCPGVCRAVIKFVDRYKDKNGFEFHSWDKDWWIQK
jgi:predicted O-methyltransferase YrrM